MEYQSEYLGFGRYTVTIDEQGCIVFEKVAKSIKSILPFFVLMGAIIFYKYYQENNYWAGAIIVIGGILFAIISPDFKPSRIVVESDKMTLWYKIYFNKYRKKVLYSKDIVSIQASPVSNRLAGKQYYSRVRVLTNNKRRITLYNDLKSSLEISEKDSLSLANMFANKLGV